MCFLLKTIFGHDGEWDHLTLPNSQVFVSTWLGSMTSPAPKAFCLHIKRRKKDSLLSLIIFVCMMTSTLKCITLKLYLPFLYFLTQPLHYVIIISSVCVSPLQEWFRCWSWPFHSACASQPTYWTWRRRQQQNARPCRRPPPLSASQTRECRSIRWCAACPATGTI